MGENKIHFPPSPRPVLDQERVTKATIELVRAVGDSSRRGIQIKK